MAENEPMPRYPTMLHHKHGLTEWWPMLPERSAEIIEPGKLPPERIYRCQKVGCLEVARIDAEAVRIER